MPKQYRLIGPDGREGLSDRPGALGGHRRGVYGRLDCGAALDALQDDATYRFDRVFFADEATATAAGYRPCGRCMPEQFRAWLTVHAAAWHGAT